LTCRCGQQKRCTPLVSLVPLVLGGSPRLVGQAAGRLVGGKSAPISRAQRMKLHPSEVPEPPLAALRFRTDAAQHPKRCDRAQAVAWKCSLGARTGSRRLDAPRPPAKVLAGGRFVDGGERTRETPLDLDCDPCESTSRVLWAFQSFAEGRNTNKPTRPSGFRVLRFRTNAVAFNLHQSRRPVPLRARCSEQRKGRTRPVPAASIA